MLATEYRDYTRDLWYAAYRAARLGNQPHEPVRMVLKQIAIKLRG